MPWKTILSESSRLIGILTVVIGLLVSIGRPAAEDFVEDVVDEKLEQRIIKLEDALSDMRQNDSSRKEQLKHISEEQDEIKELILRALTERRN